MNKKWVLEIIQATSEQNYTCFSQLTKEYIKIIIWVLLGRCSHRIRAWEYCEQVGVQNLWMWERPKPMHLTLPSSLYSGRAALQKHAQWVSARRAGGFNKSQCPNSSALWDTKSWNYHSKLASFLMPADKAVLLPAPYQLHISPSSQYPAFRAFPTC